MEIILKEDIIGLGYKNDIVNVKSGYGRNYLIPQGKGVIACWKSIFPRMVGLDSSGWSFSIS